MNWFPADPRLRMRLWGVLLIALTVRIGAAVGLQHLLDDHWHRQFLIPGDAEGYWELAGRMARGEPYCIYTPPRYVLRMPGFPAILALSIGLFGESLFAARLLLAGVGTLACWLVSVLGSRMFNEKTGVLAAAIAALYPVFVVFSVVELSETCFAAAILLCLIAGNSLIHSLQRGASLRGVALRAAATGVTVALATYVHPSWIAAGPLFSVLLPFCSRNRWAGVLAGCVVVAATVLTLLPWGWRNQQVTGHFTLTTFWVGPSLYDGLNPTATGESDMTFFDEEQLPAKMSEYEVDQAYRRRAMEFAETHPGQTLKLAVAKLWRFLKPWPNAEEFGSLWISLCVGGCYIPAMLLAAWGGWTARNRIWSVVILSGPILYFAALHLVFVSSLRYRLPAEYPLLILTAAGVLNVCQRRPHRN